MEINFMPLFGRLNDCDFLDDDEMDEIVIELLSGNGQSAIALDVEDYPIDEGDRNDI